MKLRMNLQKNATFIFFIFFLLFPAWVWGAGFEHDLYFGMTQNNEVKELQEFLREQGVYHYEATGNFLTRTRDAVKQFQEREGIAPVEGYFGIKTRTRANAMMMPSVSSRDAEIAALKAKIADLEATLKKLIASEQEKTVIPSSAPSVVQPSPPPSVDSTPPAFLTHFKITKQEFATTSTVFGAHFPYRVLFDWQADDTAIKELIMCAPGLKSGNNNAKNTEYYPEPHTEYVCTLTFEDAAGNNNQESLHFVSPSWVAIGGGAQRSFPDTAVSPLKLGEITFFNGTTTDILVSQLVLRIVDLMNSALNRSKEVTFLLRDGLTYADTLLSSTKFQFNSREPRSDNPFRSLVNLPSSILLKTGEERTLSLWVEGFEYVTGGSLSFEIDRMLTIVEINPVNTFRILLTR